MGDKKTIPKKVTHPAKKKTFAGCYSTPEIVGLLSLKATAMQKSKSSVLRQCLRQWASEQIKKGNADDFRTILTKRFQEEWYRILYGELSRKKESEVTRRFEQFIDFVKADLDRKGLCLSDIVKITKKLGKI